MSMWHTVKWRHRASSDLIWFFAELTDNKWHWVIVTFPFVSRGNITSELWFWDINWVISQRVPWICQSTLDWHIHNCHMINLLQKATNVICGLMMDCSDVNLKAFFVKTKLWYFYKRLKIWYGNQKKWLNSNM